MAVIATKRGILRDRPDLVRRSARVRKLSKLLLKRMIRLTRLLLKLSRCLLAEPRKLLPWNCLTSMMVAVTSMACGMLMMRMRLITMNILIRVFITRCLLKVLNRVRRLIVLFSRRLVLLLFMDFLVRRLKFLLC